MKADPILELIHNCNQGDHIKVTPEAREALKPLIEQISTASRTAMFNDANETIIVSDGSGVGLGG